MKEFLFFSEHYLTGPLPAILERYALFNLYSFFQIKSNIPFTRLLVLISLRLSLLTCFLDRACGLPIKPTQNKK